MLIATAKRLRARMRKDDLVARLGGDEFAVLLSAIDAEEQIAQVARDITLAMRRPIILDAGTPVAQSLSIGASLGKNHADPQALMDQADSAMYRIKQQGGAGIFRHHAGRKLMRRCRPIRRGYRTSSLPLFSRALPGCSHRFVVRN